MIAPSGGNEGTADILRMLEQLGETIDQPRGFGPIIWGLNREEVLMQIAKIRASLPTELKQAAQRVRESERIVEGARDDASATMDQAKREADRIIAEARREAERLIEHAKIQQERMVAESEILKLAKAQSEELRNTADRDAVQIRRGAENYAMDVLQRLEGVIGKVMHSIERGKQDLDRNEASVGRDRALLK